MRTIKYIAVHCTAGNQDWGVKELLAEFKRKGWKNPGYHYVVTKDGKIHQMLDEAKVSNGVYGFNGVTINVAYTGGVDTSNGLRPVDNRTEGQKRGLRALVAALHRKYPHAVVQGHRDFKGVRKACPCFDARGEYEGVM